MTPRSVSPSDAARRLWESAAGDTSAPEDVAAAAGRVCAQLRAGLGRWIGGEGYRALLDRALVLARAEHPALGSLSCDRGDQPVTPADVRAHGAAKVAAGMVALVAMLIELLSRMVGEEMAVRLVEQTGKPSPRGVVSNEPEGERDA
jgi:hypothetical protein